MLRKTSNRDSHFLLACKLFSPVISKEMAQYEENHRINYYFQQDFLEVFEKFIDKAVNEGDDQKGAEQRAAKILWNYIENNRLGHLFSILLKNREENLTPEKDIELINRFKITENLV
ncbi:MAG: hypothetical protein ACXACR_11850, partial [Candidatus Hodarchaeales archaeon]